MKRLVLILLLAGWTAVAPAGRRPGRAAAEAVHVLHVGDAVVRVVLHGDPAAPWSFLNLHDDEDTSVEAARQVVQAHGGRIVELRYAGGRNIAFGLNGATYTFDPNRIFTDRGARATLQAHGPFSPEALHETRRFAAALLALYRFDAQAAVVTLHNNTDGNYSVLSYLPGGAHAREAQEVHVVDGRDPDDFFFVTDRDLFERLAEKGFNVVLQHNDAATDDGSLSVYAGRRGKPYVNVEAEHGHLHEQVEMVRALYALL